MKSNEITRYNNQQKIPNTFQNFFHTDWGVFVVFFLGGEGEGGCFVLFFYATELHINIGRFLQNVFNPLISSFFLLKTQPNNYLLKTNLRNVSILLLTAVL